MLPKAYLSKDEIYRDFDIALKLALERNVSHSDYNQIRDSLSRDCKAKFERLAEEIRGFQVPYSLSSGFFLEIPVEGDTGQEIGSKFLLMQHETGWELFIPLASALAAWLGPRVFDKLADKALDAAMDKLTDFLKTHWDKLMRGGVRIDHVEIRTQQKGVMRIPFSQFEARQMKCLLRKFSSISNISDCNAECFGGLLVTPPPLSDFVRRD